MILIHDFLGPIDCCDESSAPSRVIGFPWAFTSTEYGRPSNYIVKSVPDRIDVGSFMDRNTNSY